MSVTSTTSTTSTTSAGASPPAPSGVSTAASAVSATSQGSEPALFGETITVVERLIVAPTRGVFTPQPVETGPIAGDSVSQGQVVGTVLLSGDETPVETAFTGIFMGFLVLPAERVRAAQPVAWLRTADG